MSDEMMQLMKVVDQHLAVNDEQGRTVLQAALLTTVYIEEPWRREVRQAVASCCESYLRRCGAELRWALDPATEKMEACGGSTGSKLRTWLQSLGEDEHFLVTCHSAEHEEGAGAFFMEALGMARRPYPQLGFFRVSFPLLWLTRREGSLPEVLLEICRTLQPVSGYGGISVIESPDGVISSRYEPVVYQWAQRLPGLEADYPDSHACWLLKAREGDRPGIKGVNWLTVLGDHFVAEMGDADRIERDLAALDSRFVVHRYEGGVMIQAGPRPELGDAQRDLWPELYVKLAKYLKPIRVTWHHAFQMSGPGERFDKARSEAWLRRFDDR